MRGLIPSIIINGLLPYIIYQVLKSYTPASDLVALAVSAIPAVISALVGIVRQRRVDMIAAIVLVGIAVTIIAVFIGGDPRLFLIRESVLTVALGIACLMSLLFPKPLWFYIMSYFVSANDPAKATEFNANWQYPGFRSFTRVLTLVWGITWTAEFILRIFLVYTLSIPQFLAISPFIFYGITIAVIAFTIYYGRLARRRGEQLREQHLQAAQAENTESEKAVETK
jgi:hypothetical protein